MKKYPYIGEHATQPIINLFTRKGCYIRLNPSDSYDGKEYPYDSDTIFGDITEKYLSNTWGVVESKEHAGFIIELAEANELTVYKDSYPIRKDIFSFNKYGTLFFHEDNGLKLSNELKQITIPLPPKDKEWPQVGDEVEFPSGKGFLFVCEPDDQGVVIVKSDDEDLGLIYKRVLLKAIKKPKTKEDILTEELQAKLCNNNYVDNFTLASDIINGMIPGLSYNSVIERAVEIVINKNLDGDDWTSKLNSI